MSQTLTRHQPSVGYAAPAARQRYGQILPADFKLLLLPLVALFVVVPLQAHGSSCGDDFPFHVSSWLDAARQMRSGVLYPHWTDLGAYNAGEPRFTFYPPISWMLGALLVLLLPSAPVTVIFIFLAITAAGFAMYTLARQYASSNVALFCAALYAANPYMVCNAVERSAFAELLCATWMPLLFLGMLRDQPTVAGLALPLSLLWLTNVPSAILGVYTFVLLFSVRIAIVCREARRSPQHGPLWQQVKPLLRTALAGLLFAIALSAVYVLPVVWEKRFILGGSAFVGDYEVSRNFLFGHDGHPIHDMFLRQASWIAVGALSVAALSLLPALRPHRSLRAGSHLGAEQKAIAEIGGMLPPRRTALLLGGMTAVIGFLLTSPSAMLWSLPELNLVQFPWRQLTVLFVAVSLSVALALENGLGKRHGRKLLLAGTVVAMLLALLSVHSYRRGSVVPHFDAYLTYLAAHDHGFLPTPEYTIAGASDAALGSNDPGFWLAATPEAPPPGVQIHQAPGHMDPNFLPGWGPATTVSQPAPLHLVLNLKQPQMLILHLRAYPNWQIFHNGVAEAARLHRADGLLAVPLPAGPSTVDLRWHRSADQYLGDAVSLLAVGGLFASSFLQRKTRLLAQGAGI